MTNDMKKNNNQIEINSNFLCKKTTCGDITEVMYCSKFNVTPTVKMIGNNHYIVLATGEVKEIVKHEHRSEHLNSLYRTFRNLRNIINTNITSKNYKQWLFITLTYRENMTDPKRLYNDFRCFFQKLRRYINKNYNLDLEYISVNEPQARGAWHIHLLLLFVDSLKAPFLNHQDIANMWGQGFITIKSINKDIDNLGAYLTAYLTDLPVGDLGINQDLLKDEKGDYENENVKIVKDEKGISKKILKGFRLNFYPVGFKLYRLSVGIKKPIEEKAMYREIKESLFGHKKTFSCIKEIKISEEKKISIVKEFYNKNL